MMHEDQVFRAEQVSAARTGGCKALSEDAGRY